MEVPERAALERSYLKHMKKMPQYSGALGQKTPQTHNTNEGFRCREQQQFQNESG